MTIINKDLIPDIISEDLMKINVIPRHMHHYENEQSQKTFITAIITYRVSVIEKGSYIIKANNKEIILKEKDILFIPPFSSYEIICNEDNSSAYIVDFKAETEEKNISELFNMKQLTIFYKAVSETFLKHINLVYKKFLSKELGYYLHIKITIDMLFIMMAISYMKDNHIQYSENQNYTSRVQGCVLEALRYIDENITKNICVAELCKHLNVSQSYLYTCFKKVMNCSVQQAISDSKLNKSLMYLRTVSLRICDVSEMVGFDNVFYFSNAFKKRFNMSPSEYRKQFTNKNK